MSGKLVNFYYKRPITWQKQPTGKTCAHTCIAMILNIPVEDVIKKMGEDTFPVEKTFEELRKNGYTIKDLNCSLPEKPQCQSLVFLLRVIKHTIVAHLAIWTGEKFICPFYGVDAKFDDTWAGDFFSYEKVENDDKIE